MVNDPLPLFAPAIGSLYVGRAVKELSLVDPLLLDEFELPLQTRPDEDERQPSFGAVVLDDAGRKQRAVAGAAPDHAMEAHEAADV